MDLTVKLREKFVCNIYFNNNWSSSPIEIYSKKDTSCAIQKCVGIEENDNIVFSSVAKPTTQI